MTIRLRDTVDHKVTTENGVVSVDLGTRAGDAGLPAGAIGTSSPASG